MDEGKAVDFVCLDVSKAFGTLSHGILLAAHGQAQKVSVKRVKSWWWPVTSGVTSGTGDNFLKYF